MQLECIIGQTNNCHIVLMMISTYAEWMIGVFACHAISFLGKNMPRSLIFSFNNKQINNNLIIKYIVYVHTMIKTEEIFEIS